MRKKLLSLLVLLMVAVTGAWAETIITWDRNNISDLYVDISESYSKEGITLSAYPGDIDAYWFGLGDEANDGIQFEAFDSGGFTFSNTLDKKFVKIEMTVRGFGDWDSANLGTGWALSEDDDNRIYKVTWTGDAASTVDLLTDENEFAGNCVKSIVFYLVGDEPEPATYTLQLVVNDPAMGSVAVTNLLGSGIVDNQDGTYTVPENAEVHLLATANEGYKFTGWSEANLNELVGCYYCGVALNTLENTLTFTMTEDKDVLAKFAALTYSVALKEGTEDAAKWTVEPTEAAAGTQVSLTYSGLKKVKSVKAVKKAAPAPASPYASLTAEDVGKIIGADGNVYADAAAVEAGGTTALVLIAYVGEAGSADASSATYKGLGLALTDASTKVAWCPQSDATCMGNQYDASTKTNDMAGIANTDYLINHAPDGHNHAAATAARNYNSGTHPTGTSEWFLPSAGQWDKMIDAAGGYATLKSNASMSEYSTCWSSTENEAGKAWAYEFYFDGSWFGYPKYYGNSVRAVLAF